MREAYRQTDRPTETRKEQREADRQTITIYFIHLIYRETYNRHRDSQSDREGKRERQTDRDRDKG